MIINGIQNQSVRTRLVLKNFTGHMITDGDASDLPDTVGREVRSLSAYKDMSALYLDREVHDQAQIGGTYSYAKGFATNGLIGAVSFFIGDDLYIVTVQVDDVTGDANIVAVKKTSESDTPTVYATNNLSSLVASYGSGKDRFIYYRGLMRFGGDSTEHGGSFDPSRTGSEFLTENSDSEGYGVISPTVWDTYGNLNFDGTKTSASYDKHTIGITITEAPHSTNTGEKSPFFNKFARYAVSFVYDGYQESPIEILAGYYEPSDSTYFPRLNLCKGHTSGLDDRITHINIYRAMLDQTYSETTDDFYFVYSVPVTGSFTDDFGQTNTWAQGDGVTFDASVDYITVTDVGSPRPESYYMRTGVTLFNRAETSTGDEQINVDYNPYWDIGTMVRARAVVHALKYMQDGEWITPERTILVSETGKPDVFYPNSYITFERGSGEFIAMRNLGPDRLLLVSETSTIVVNVSNEPVYWFVENELGIGASHSGRVVDSDVGIFIIGDKHLYLVDFYGELHILTNHLKEFWRSCDFSIAVGGYDNRHKRLYISRITYSFATIGVSYDIESKALIIWDAPIPATFMVSGFNADLYFGSVNTTTDVCTLYKAGDNSSNMECVFVTKKFDCQLSDVDKLLRKVRVRYKCPNDSVSLRVYDETDSLMGTLQTMPASSAVTEYEYHISGVFKEIYVDTRVTTDGDFELHEISIEYMIKAM